MQIRLMCMKNSWTQGIMDHDGRIHLDALEKHVQGCKDCARYYTKNILTMLHKTLDERQPKQLIAQAPIAVRS